MVVAEQGATCVTLYETYLQGRHMHATMQTMRAEGDEHGDKHGGQSDKKNSILKVAMHMHHAESKLCSPMGTKASQSLLLPAITVMVPFRSALYLAR